MCLPTSFSCKDDVEVVVFVITFSLFVLLLLLVAGSHSLLCIMYFVVVVLFLVIYYLCPQRARRLRLSASSL